MAMSVCLSDNFPDRIVNLMLFYSANGYPESRGDYYRANYAEFTHRKFALGSILADRFLSVDCCRHYNEQYSISNRYSG